MVCFQRKEKASLYFFIMMGLINRKLDYIKPGLGSRLVFLTAPAPHFVFQAAPTPNFFPQSAPTSALCIFSSSGSGSPVKPFCYGTIVL